MFLFSYSLYWISPRPNTADLAHTVDLVSIWIDLLSIWKSLHLIGQNSRARSCAALKVLKQKQWRRFSRSSEIVNKQAKIISASLKRMSDMGANKVLADDMGRCGLLTVN